MGRGGSPPDHSDPSRLALGGLGGLGHGVLPDRDRLGDVGPDDHRTCAQVLGRLDGPDDRLVVATGLAADVGLDAVRQCLAERRPALGGDLRGGVLTQLTGGERQSGVAEAVTLVADVGGEGDRLRHLDAGGGPLALGGLSQVLEHWDLVSSSRGASVAECRVGGGQRRPPPPTGPLDHGPAALSSINGVYSRHMAVKYGHVERCGYVGPERYSPSIEVHSENNVRVHHSHVYQKRRKT